MATDKEIPSSLPEAASARSGPDPVGAAAAGTRVASEPARRESLIPYFAVGVVATAALAAALMSAPSPAPELATEQAAAAASANTNTNTNEVVQAPPLAAKTAVNASAEAGANPNARTAANAMGAPPACRNCGVVQMVVAVHGYAQPRPSGYQMHIRMDDGSTRTVQQRGALAAGSRVMVEGDSVRVLAQRSSQG